MSAGEGIGLPAPGRAVSHRVHGPSALTGDLRRFWSLTFTLARTEFKLRFFGSALGYVWTLVRPLLLFGVLYVFFTKIGHVNNSKNPGEHFYGVQLLGSIVLFTFFAEATGGAVRSMVDRENLLRKVHFPRLVIPASVVLLALFNLGLNLLVVMAFAIGSGVHPMLSWLELPLIVLAITLLAAGVAMLLSALFVHFRDIQPIWEVVNQVLFYASGILIPVELLKERLSATEFHLLMLNPLAIIVEQFRHAMIDNSAPSAVDVLGGWWQLLEPIGIIVAIFVIGFWVFNRSAPLIAENL
jgi:ABC-2 type transport system permease protein